MSVDQTITLGSSILKVIELIQVTQEIASVETRCRYKNGGEII
jgi:hypothetical protein